MSRPSHLRAAQRLGAPRLRPLIAALCGAGCFASAFAQAPAPTTMPVLAGQATQPVAGAGSVNTNGSTTANPVQNYLQTSGTAVWHFDSFSIGSAGRVTNTALNARDLTVFRVVGPGTSELAGGLTANNRVYLINRDGIHVHRGASFGGGGSLVLSTLDLDPDLAADNYAALLADPTYVRFVSDAGVPSGYGGYGGYGDFSDATLDVEEGVTMVAGDGGSIFLVGDRVRNQGTLRANGGGSVGVVAAGTVEMEVGDSGFIRLVSYEALPAEGQGSNLSVRRVALNAGNIEATDGTVVIAQANLYNRNNGGDLAPTPAVLTAGYGTEQSPNGAYNTGAILARGVNGQGSVTVDARGENNAAVNAGTIDVSAANGTAQAGSILMTGHKVLVGGHGDGDGVGAVARLLANGPSGGGNITLDTRNATDSEASALVHTNSASLIEANATAAGNGGNVVLSTDILGDGPVTWRNPSGRVESLGQIRAVGAGGGQGGTLTIAAPQVFIAEREGVAGSTLGAGGLWRLISSNILIGGGSGGANTSVAM